MIARLVLFEYESETIIEKRRSPAQQSTIFLNKTIRFLIVTLVGRDVRRTSVRNEICPKTKQVKSVFRPAWTTINPGELRFDDS